MLSRPVMPSCSLDELHCCTLPCGARASTRGFRVRNRVLDLENGAFVLPIHITSLSDAGLYRDGLVHDA